MSYMGEQGVLPHDDVHSLYELLRFEERLEVTHLPGSHHQQDHGLGKGPPQNSLVGGFGGLSESLLPVPLVVLLLGDLLYLVQKLSHSQLQFGQLFLLCNVSVVDGMLSYLNVQVHSQLCAREPFGGVTVQTDHVLPGVVGGKCELALAAVHLAENDFIVGISDLHVHSNLGAGRGKSVRSGIVQLDLVISCDHGFVGNFLDKAFPLCFCDVKVERIGHQRQQAQQSVVLQQHYSPLL